MSHEVEIEFKIQSLTNLKDAVKALGWNWLEQNHYTFWGNQQAECDYAIHIPGQTFEIGVKCAEDHSYDLVCDSYLDKKLTSALCVEYTKQVVIEDMIMQGGTLEESEDSEFLTLEITV